MSQMAAEDPSSTNSMLAQILLEQGKQSTQLAVIVEQLKMLPDHESRLRNIEKSTPSADDLGKQEERVSKLEAWKGRQIGISVSWGTISGALAWLLSYITHH